MIDILLSLKFYSLQYCFVQFTRTLIDISNCDGFTLAKDVIIIISAVLHILMLWILMAQ